MGDSFDRHRKRVHSTCRLLYESMTNFRANGMYEEGFGKAIDLTREVARYSIYLAENERPNDEVQTYLNLAQQYMSDLEQEIAEFKRPVDKTDPPLRPAPVLRPGPGTGTALPSVFGSSGPPPAEPGKKIPVFVPRRSSEGPSTALVEPETDIQPNIASETWQSISQEYDWQTMIGKTEEHELMMMDLWIRVFQDQTLNSDGAASSSSGLRIPVSVLVYGPPGTGKTFFVKAMARHLRLNLYSASASTILDKYVGESEKRVQALFRFARQQAPCILFIDEIDQLFGRRKDGEQGNTDVAGRVQTEFLVHWEKEIEPDRSTFIIVGCTNRPNAIDAANMRRFPILFQIDYPPVSSVVDYLVKHIHRISKEDTQAILNLLHHGTLRPTSPCEDSNHFLQRSVSRMTPAPVPIKWTFSDARDIVKKYQSRSYQRIINGNTRFIQTQLADRTVYVPYDPEVYTGDDLEIVGWQDVPPNTLYLEDEEFCFDLFKEIVQSTIEKKQQTKQSYLGK